MEFRNLTPFDAILWSAEDVDAEEFHIVALRVGYRLIPEPIVSDAGAPTHQCVLIEGDDAPSLEVEDRYFGDLHVSSVRSESDLAPFKPRCDVLVNATAFAPGGTPAARWTATVRVSRPDGAALLEKTLSVCGPRWFERTSTGWSLSDPAPTSEVPVRWELAYGGTSHVTEAGLHEACFVNPIGRGWVEARWLDALERAGQPAPSRLAAPQIEDPRRPVTGLDVVNQEGVADTRQMAEAVKRYAGTPAGLSALGRAWTPRLQRAGTYDEAWQKERWPHLPGDFDFAYWNAAPDDQQLAELPPDALIELFNLVAPEHAPGGILRAKLPGHRAFTTVWGSDSAPMSLGMYIDTLLIDTEALRLDVVWRTAFPRTLAIRVAKVGFEFNPATQLPNMAVAGQSEVYAFRSRAGQ
jgi:hypothetical protein